MATTNTPKLFKPDTALQETHMIWNISVILTGEKTLGHIHSKGKLNSKWEKKYSGKGWVFSPDLIMSDIMSIRCLNLCNCPHNNVFHIRRRTVSCLRRYLALTPSIGTTSTCKNWAGRCLQATNRKFWVQGNVWTPSLSSIWSRVAYDMSPSY